MTHCCGHIVVDRNVSPFARGRNICCGHKFCVRDTKNVSDFVQKHFVFATIQMFPSVRSPRNIMGNNVSGTMCPRLPGPLVCVMYDIVEAIACTLKSALQKWQVHFSII